MNSAVLFTMVTEPQSVREELFQESVSSGVHHLQLCPRQPQEPRPHGELVLCGILLPASSFF